MWQTIGQPKVLALFKHGLEMGNLAHAYLLVGPHHIGKSTLALDLAKAVNCEGRLPPCGECPPCHRITSGKHADITIIGLNSAQGSGEAKRRVAISINDIKELQHSASFPPYEGKHRVFIIDGAESLSDEAANCLLKTLEEPPPRVIVLLLTAEELELLPTVVSRCQRVELTPISSGQVEKVLIESRGVDSDRARLLARLSQGCLGWALKASVDNSYLAQRTQRLSEMFSLLAAHWEERFVYAAQLPNDRESAEQTINLWLMWWRDVMLTKCDSAQTVTNIDYASTLEEWAETLTLPQTRNFIKSLQESLSQISKNANLRLVFEILMLDMPRKEEKTRHAISPMPVTL